uniref:Myrosinase-binding protein 2-1 n=1 Tax=Isatis tinctoria TaxID=161756 RepID=A0A8E9ZRY5_ISATI|nr:myrosinase-binding protein 2-1 [Isatis tinctoria]
MMSEKVGAVGGNFGGAFDDGVFDGVKKIIVGRDLGCVSYIKIEYEKDGKFETREHGTIRGALTEFAVEYPNEYITSVGGSYDRVPYYETVLIRSLIFKTSLGRTSPVLGETSGGRGFMFEGKTGGKLLGFHGRSGQALDAIGTYFFTVNAPLKHFNREGGNGGSAWDDGAYDGVRKILVGRGGNFVSYVRFEYAKGERTISHDHGKRQEVPQEFVVDYPHEHITLVEGTIDGYLTSLRFKTSKGRTSPAFGNVVGRRFVFEEKDFKLVGFCGRSGDVIDALGAHFSPLPPPAPSPSPSPSPSSSSSPSPVPAPALTSTKRGPIGGIKGNIFDDGVFNGVKKITVGKDVYSVTYIKIEYVKDGKDEIREHGTNRGELKEFSVNYPNEYITAVGGSYNHIYNYDTTLITSLYFKTSKGFTSPLFGEMKGTEFELKGENGGKVLGFHGRGGHAIDAIGAFFETLKLSVKMGPIGGSKGNTFDDGVFDGVKKVTVGKDAYSITYIKMEYANGGKFETREHGTERGEIKEFSVDYPNENIVVVGGSYKHIYNYDTTLITSLYFTTSKGFTSPLFGEMKGTEFELKGENGGKLIGIHGRGGHAIDAIGAHFESRSGI